MREFRFIHFAFGFVLGATPAFADPPAALVVHGHPRILPLTGQPAFGTDWFPTDHYAMIQLILDRPITLSTDAFAESVRLSDAVSAKLVSPAPVAGCEVLIHGTLKRSGYSQIGTRLNGSACQAMIRNLHAEDLIFEFSGVPSDRGEVIAQMEVHVDSGLQNDSLASREGESAPLVSWQE